MKIKGPEHTGAKGGRSRLGLGERMNGECACKGAEVDGSVVRILDDFPNRGRNEDPFQVEPPQGSCQNEDLSTAGVSSIDEDHRFAADATKASFTSYSGVSQVFVPESHTEAVGNFFEVLEEGRFVHELVTPELRIVGKIG